MWGLEEPEELRGVAVAAWEVPKTQVDGAEEILTGTERWEPGWSTLKSPSLFPSDQSHGSAG